MFTSILLFTSTHLALTFILSSLLVRLTYKRYGQGLSKYPGPFLASLTNLYRLYDVSINTSILPMLALHRKYGDVVRYGPNMLCFSDPQAIKDIYIGTDACPKSEFYSTAELYISGEKHNTIFSLRDEKQHGKMRRVVGPAFTMSSIAQLEDYIDATIDTFMQTLDERFVDDEGGKGKELDMMSWMQYFAFDVLGQLLYGEPHGFIEKGGDLEDIIAISDFGTKYDIFIGQMPWLDYLLLKNPLFLFLTEHKLIKFEFVPLPFALKQLALREQNRQIALSTNTDTNTNANEKSQKKKRDLLDRLIESQTKNPGLLTDIEIAKVCAMLVFAGSDTTATTLSALFYYLLKNPTIYTKLQAEIDAATAKSPNQNIRFADAQALPYLDACIKEIFRYHPAAGFNPERVVPSPGRKIGSHFVPRGTIVSVSTWALHRNPALFGEDVDVFRPERWLVGAASEASEASQVAVGEARITGDASQAVGETSQEEEKEKEKQKENIKNMWSSMFHFGAGNHMCMGRHISLLEVYKLVPVILSRFELTLASEGPNGKWTTYNMGFVKPVGLKVRLRKRVRG